MLRVNLSPSAEPIFEVLVCLEWHADQRSDGIGKLFGEFRGLVVSAVSAAKAALIETREAAARRKPSL